MDQIEIINLGLGHISQRPIEDLNEQSTEAEVASLFWEPCLKECLRGNNWPFASVIDALAEVSNYTAPNGWSYAYAYPASSLAFWRLSNAFTDPNNKKGEDFKQIYVPSLRVKVILANVMEAYGEYTYYVDDTSIYDPAFVNAFSYRLAAAFAMPLNADPELAKSAAATYQNLMSDAQRQSSYENNTNNGEKSTTIVDSRMNGLPTPSVSIGGMTFNQFNQGG